MAKQKPKLPNKAARDNHSINNNPNNEQYYKSRDLPIPETKPGQKSTE